MIWFDPSATFARGFEQVEGGYLYYPRAKSGGKLVTPAEYEKRVGDYRGWMGRRFWPGLLFWATLAGIVSIEVVNLAFGLSSGASEVSVYVLATALLGLFLWFHSAPYRLLRHRPDAVPPRSRVRPGQCCRGPCSCSEEVLRPLRLWRAWPRSAAAPGPR
jgi:hypothetical protein